MRTTSLLIALAAGAACGKLSNDSDSSDSGGLEILAGSPVNMNENFTMTVNKPDLVKSYAWALKDAEGGTVDACQSYIGAEITCMVEFPGTYNVELVAELKGGGDPAAVTTSIDVLDPAAPSDQAPVILLDIKVGDDKIGSVATFVALEDGRLAVKQNAAVTFDFTGTTDKQDVLETLKFYLDVGSGLEEVPPVSQRTFTKVKVIEAKVEVHDPQGNIARKKFNIFVQCDEGEYGPVVIDASGVTISADDPLNFFSYTLSESAITGGKGPFKIMWDYNGDGMFDGDWTDELSAREYTVYRGLRDVQIKAWDTGCNYFGKLELGKLDPPQYDFEIPMADGVAGTKQGPQIPGYYFLQAKLNGLDGNDTKTTNVDFVSTWKIGSAEQPKRVMCDYRKQSSATSGSEGSQRSNFEIKALNKYVKADGSAVNHGMILGIVDIDDAIGHASGGEMTEGESIEKHIQGRVSTVNYYTDTSADAVSQNTYQRQGECAFDMFIEFRPLGPGTCSTNPDLGYTTIIDGTFSCPQMVTSAGLKVEAEQGAFFCEVAKVDACPPGGGGGGGGLPPIPK